MSSSPPRPAVPPTAPAPPPPRRDDGTAPRPLGDRLWLLLSLLLLPAFGVALPTLLVTHFFGQRPAPKVASPAPDTSSLRLTLEHSAGDLLPAPSALSPEPITVTVRADHLAARMDKITRQAQGFGGSASEGLSTATEKHLSVDLPAGRAEAFRQAVRDNAPAASPAPAVAAGGGRDYVEVVIRAAGDDE